MVTRVLDHVPHCYTADDGLVVAALIADAIGDGRTISLSFSGVNSVPSSFVNAAFVSLLDRYGADAIRRSVRVVDSTAQINSMIRDRLAAEAAKRRPAGPPHAAGRDHR